MKKGYIITGSYYTGKTIYTNKEKAERACEEKNYCIGCSGSCETVHVEEVEINDEE